MMTAKVRAKVVKVSLVKVSPVKVESLTRVMAVLVVLMTTPVGMMPAKALSSRQPTRWLRSDSSKP